MPRKLPRCSGQFYWPTNIFDRHSHRKLAPPAAFRPGLVISRTKRRPAQFNLLRTILLSIVSSCPLPDKRTPRCQRTLIFPTDPIKISKLKLRGWKEYRTHRSRQRFFKNNFHKRFFLPIIAQATRNQTAKVGPDVPGGRIFD